MSTPQIVAVANMAGSAGKTTTVVTLAALLAEDGVRVAVVDLDAQATATFSLGIDDPDRQLPTIGDVLLRRATLSEVFVETSAPGVRVVPANADLNGATVELGRALGPEQRLTQALEASTLDADVVLLDCPGAMNVLTLNALVAADAVVAVTQPTTKELAGLPVLEDTVAEVAAAWNKGLQVVAIVPCIVPSSGALYAEGLKLLRESYEGAVTVTHPVRRSVRVPEAFDAGRPLPQFAPTHDVTQDYREVLNDLRAAGALPAVTQEA